MEGRPVIPDGQVVLAPLVAHLKIVVLRDVTEEVFEDVIGLFLAQLDNTLGEAIGAHSTINNQTRLRNRTELREARTFC